MKRQNFINFLVSQTLEDRHRKGGPIFLFVRVEIGLPEASPV